VSGLKKINSALISVYHKDNLEPIVRKLSELAVKIFSTGGTQQFIQSLGIGVTAVESLTSYPPILGGRVKTLHPKIFGGILGRRENKGDVTQLEEYDIPPIDLVVVDLYPFESTVASGAPEDEIIEKIDIGGISLIRAAAKNFHDVLIIPSRSDYKFLIDLLREKNGFSTLTDRRKMAARAFDVSSHYDMITFNYFMSEAGQNELLLNTEKKPFKQSIHKSKMLRYGENPHQQGIFYGDLDAFLSQFSGKELSYNNLLDIDAAVNLMAEFSEPTFAILKHNNACGLASRQHLAEAWKDALAGDPVSAFGGVLVTNRNVDAVTAEEINKLFFEVIVAPSYEEKAVAVLKQKANRIILQQKDFSLPGRVFRTILNGVLVQDRDSKADTSADMKVVTKRQPEESEITDLEFANKIVKHTKSNAIVLAINKQLLAAGTGQTSRIDALKQAIQKAKEFNHSLKGAVMASDAFFPFPDCVEIAFNNGIRAVIQPGGSIKDRDSIEYCDKQNMAMIFTGTRHFKH
jgi:phosphoribosylaminoimidazolecarboxamide formyltransferase/IMP cyclohydrolase